MGVYQKRYIQWLCRFLGDINGYSKLLDYLYQADFVWIIPMDENRAKDGINLRFQFCDIYRLDSTQMQEIFGSKPCSMLEMMIALAIRIEDDFMGTENQNNTSRWFWSMIFSMGLQLQKDEYFNPEKVDSVILHFIEHRYGTDGRGSLFHVPMRNVDFRNLQIWDQMNYWLILMDKKGGNYS